jgi:reactive intermediate/imine deaminase
MQAITTELAPQAIGTYSQAIRSGNMVFLSGQIPLCPKTNALVSDDMAEQIQQVFENLSAVCKASGGSLANIVSLTIYLQDLSHFNLVNEAMTRFFTEPFPARATVAVLALPKNALVEVSAIMVV